MTPSAPTPEIRPARSTTPIGAAPRSIWPAASQPDGSSGPGRLPLQSRRGPGRGLLLSGLGALLVLGGLLEGLILGLWPLSYDLTQGPDFSYEYLLQYPQVWEVFRPLLEQFEATFPTAATSLDQLTGLLSTFWIASFALYFSAFLILRELPQRWWLALPVVAFTLLFQVTFCLMPGTFTTDLFSYAMYGYIPRVYELNPYIYVPGYFPGNRMTSWIHPVWYYTPSIYGPVWIDFSVWLTGLTRERSMVDQALAYRLVSNVAHLANLVLIAGLIWKLAPRRPVALFLLAAWNPLLLFEFAGSGHNDSFMMTLVLLSCLLAVFGRYVLAVVALAMAALVKVTPVLLLPVLLFHWAGRQRTRSHQLLTLVGGGLLALAVAVAFYWPWYAGPETFQLVDYWSRGPMYMNYVPDLLAQTLGDQVLDPDRLDQQAAWETARTWVKWATRLIFLTYFAWELRQVWRGASLLAAMSRVFAAFLLLVNTWVLAWYWTWPLMLAIPLGWERLGTRILVGFSFTAPLMMYVHHYWSVHMPPWFYLLYLSPLLLALPELRRTVDLLPRPTAERSPTRACSESQK